MKILTIITTTYNRGYCLHQLYNSLFMQQSRDFIWLIVVVGSTDNTRDVVEKFMVEADFEIRYVYQQNKGMTGARNTAYRYVDTEINIIIDSDDWMAPNAVARIIEFWNSNKRDDIAGIIALDVDKFGKVIGTQLPQGVKESTSIDMRLKYRMKGDKKFIFRSSISKLYPYPEIEGENFFPPSYKFYQIDQSYTMLLMNEAVCVVDYNDDSMSFDKIAQYKSCAKSFAMYRDLCVKLSPKLSFTLIQLLHYISASRFAGNKHYIKNSSKPLLAFIIWPFGLIFHEYLKRTKRKALSVPVKV